MPILFALGMHILTSFYESVPSGDTILEDIKGRPLLALTMLLGNLLGILSFVVGLLAIVRKKERSVIVYISTILGGLFTIFVISQILP